MTASAASAVQPMVVADRVVKSFGSHTVLRDISAETFNPIPMLIVASLWYLFFTSILMTGQFFLERRFARGTRFVDVGPGTPTDAPTAPVASSTPAAHPTKGDGS